MQNSFYFSFGVTKVQDNRLWVVMMPIDFEKNIYPLKDKLYRFSLSILGNIKDAEDIVQDTFVKIWNRRSQLDQIDNIEAWSMRATRNLCLDKLKKKGRLYSEIGKHSYLEDQSVDLAKALDLKDKMSEVKKIISNLPEKQRAILSLRDIEGFSYKEISEVLDISLNDVKSGIHRGRKKIQQELIKNDEYGIE